MGLCSLEKICRDLWWEEVEGFSVLESEDVEVDGFQL